MAQVHKTSIAEIRASSGLDPNDVYLTYDLGVPGEWQIDETDTTTPDNTGWCVVSGSGQRLKRRWYGYIDLAWWNIPKAGGDISVAFMSALALANANRVRHVSSQGVFYDEYPVISVPNGRYIIDNPITNMIDGLYIRGNGSSFTAGAPYPQTEFLFSGTDVTGWQLTCKDLTFEDFDFCFDLNNNNRGAGQLIFDKILFIGGDLSVRMNCRSSKTLFNNCRWHRTRRGVQILNGDMVEFRGCSVFAGASWLTEWVADTYFIENFGDTGGSHVYLENFYATPGEIDTSIINDVAWIGIRAQNSLRVVNSRFGGEFNSCPICISESTVATTGHHTTIQIENSDIGMDSSDQIRAAVMLKGIPNEVSVKNCSGTSFIPYVDFHYSVADPSLLVSALTDAERRRICMDVSGNTMANSSDMEAITRRWGDIIPIELEPFNKTYRSMAGIEITGTDIDFRIRGARFKNITTDIALTTSNEIDGKEIQVSIHNDDANPHTLTITGVPFPDGAVNSIPAGGHAYISLQQINGFINAGIRIYS